MAAHPASASDQAMPDELLSVLLEVRAHVDAIGAQAGRVLDQLERLDARVAALEQRSAAARDSRPMDWQRDESRATRERAALLDSMQV